MATTVETQVVVLGGGPGGYSAAFRAADLGLKVLLIERYSELGGVCLNVGCIPSKTLLHIAEIISGTYESESIGLKFKKPIIDIDKVREFKSSTVGKLTQGISGMAKMRGVHVVHGIGKFLNPNEISIDTSEGVVVARFEYAIIAAGSSAIKLPFAPNNDPRIWDSTRALELTEVPERLLIVGGGIIGLEMATVYRSLGSHITIAEFSDQLVPAADSDLVKIYQKYNNDQFDTRLKTKVVAINPDSEALSVVFETEGNTESRVFDAILIAIGRRPNGKLIGAEEIGISVDQSGFIFVDEQCRTNLNNIFAVGDIVGNPMLAHKATHQGHVAAEVIAGHKTTFDPRAIPSIAYTNPEIAWTGLTEKEASLKELDYETAIFPWSASGRALGAGRSEGRTKLIYDKKSGKLLGAGIVGINAGEIIGELTLAIEFGADVEDLALTIHAHPTLHETVGLAGELAAGKITDLPNPKAQKLRK